MPNQSLRSRVAIITGGASGLGRTIALRLAREGADICIMSLSKERVRLAPSELKYFPTSDEINEVQEAISETGVRCVALDGDVSAASNVEHMVQAAIQHFGRLDILVNNAATDCVHPVLDHDDSSWRRVIEVNLIGAYLCARAALPHMIANRWGRIVSIGSTNSHVGTANYSAYAASKHGLLGFNRSLALEVAEHNITANTVSPGIIETPSGVMHIRKSAENAKMTFQEMRAHFIDQYPQKRFVPADEIAALVCFLCQEEAKAINGEDIRITTGAAY